MWLILWLFLFGTPALADRLPDIGEQIKNSKDYDYIQDGCLLAYDFDGAHLVCGSDNAEAKGVVPGACTDQFIRSISSSEGPRCYKVNLERDVTGTLGRSNLPSDILYEGDTDSVLAQPIILDEAPNPGQQDPDQIAVYANEDQGYTVLRIEDDTAQILQVFRDDFLIVKNVTGSTIAAGKVVYASGANAGYVTIALADATDEAKMPSIGVTLGAITNGSFGRVLTKGEVSIDTSGFSAGNFVYVSDSSPGELTATKPVSPDLAQLVGVVKTSANPGKVEVLANQSISSPDSWAFTFDGGSFSTDGTYCDSVEEVVLNSSGKTWALICNTPDNAAFAYTKLVTLPTGYGGTDFDVTLVIFASASFSGTIDIACQCRGNGETVDNNWGTPVAFAPSSIGANTLFIEASDPNTPMVCDGAPCVAKDLLRIRLNEKTGNANGKILGVLVETP